MTTTPAITEAAQSTSNKTCIIKKPWLRRLGIIVPLLFLIKGLAWLVVPAVLAWAASR